jgi:hypothetical protein
LNEFTNTILALRKSPDVSARELAILKKLDDYGMFLKKNILDYKE